MNFTKENLNEFIQANSPDGGFLQSDEWRKFQQAVGRKTFNVFLPSPPAPLPEGEERLFFLANIVEHALPVVGKYFYIPRGPVIPAKAGIQPLDSSATFGMTKIMELAKKENAGWIRFDPSDEKITELIHELIPEFEIKKAPHDMQPKELFIIDITKSEEQLLAEMKSKTRYNIKVAQKRGVKIINCHPERSAAKSKDLIGADSSTALGVTAKYLNEFLRLIKITAQRDGITPHPENYYRKMFEAIPEENIKLYIAEYDNKVVTANINIIFGKTATYLHGASDNEYRNVMAPYLLQWQAMLDAKTAGCEKYDFGGISTNYESSTNVRITNSWAGITRFKTGFSTATEPTKFPGSHDVIINKEKYKIYKILQKLKSFV